MTSLYVYLYDEKELDLLASMLRKRAEAGCMVRHLLFGYDSPGTYPGALRDWAQVQEAVGDYVEEVTNLGEEGYNSTYALCQVLPSIVSRKEMVGVWPPWTEWQAFPSTPLLR
ncbi:hypothetical protein C8Q76DRAFT_698367 [Earliella scabrosa]|nr:hypothetical protein C8Q76DRAFT_698367 [Earliella scabrosa]